MRVMDTTAGRPLYKGVVKGRRRVGAIAAIGLVLVAAAVISAAVCVWTACRRFSLWFVITLILAAAGIAALSLTLPVFFTGMDLNLAAGDDLTRRMQEIQLQKRQEQLNALQSQINPHFLYNTLDTIQGMAIEKDCMEVADIVASLSSMFKYSMDYSTPVVSLNSEIEQVKRYMAIQEQRFPGRYKLEEIYECDMRDISLVELPKFSLQPIVENAVSHGLKGRPSLGRIEFRYCNTGYAFRVTISDNGAGMQEEQVSQINDRMGVPVGSGEAIPGGSGGIALSNVNTRLKMYCGEKYGLHVASTLGLGTQVTMTLPLPERNEKKNEERTNQI